MPTASAFLLDDGTSYLLQEDGTSALLLEAETALNKKTLSANPAISIAAHGATLLGFLLQEDGSSYFLLQDGSGRLLLEARSWYDLTTLYTATAVTIGTRAGLLATFRSASTISVSTSAKIILGHIGGVSITLDGVPVRARVGSITIHDILNDAPNTCSLTLNAPAPRVDQKLKISIQDATGATLVLFQGTIQDVQSTYDLLPNQQVYPCQAIDDTAQANYLRPFGTYVNVSASAVGLDLCAKFAPSFDTSNIVASLPPVTITFDGSESFIACFARMASMIGAYSKVDQMAVYLFFTDATNTPDPIDSAHKFLDAPHIQATRDTSQQRTRVYGRGNGQPLLVDVAAGATILPILDISMYTTAGGKGIASMTSGGATSERFTYTGVDDGGVGSLAGPGAAPSVAPTVAATTGVGLALGVYSYAYTDVTAAGESLPSPLGVATTGIIAAPTTAPTARNQQEAIGYAAGGFAIGDVLAFKLSYSTDPAGYFNNETALSPASAGITLIQHPSFPGYFQNVYVTAPFSPDPAVQFVHLWCSHNGAAYQWFASGGITNQPVPPGGIFQEGVFNGTVNTGQFVPTPNTSLQQVAVTGIALGPAGTTSRKVYRTVVNGSQLKLLTTLGDNTTTSLTDARADGSLGANAPTADTSGLQPAAGQINAGSTSLMLASAAPFSPTGGWVNARGNQVVRYTGISGNTLTGIPATGAGSLVTTVQYGDVIVSVPALIGVSGLANGLMAGSKVCIFVQRDDVNAQATYGIIEYLIVDERRAEPSLTALCDADLQRFARPIVTVTYATRDTKSKSGKTIAINLASPPINETLTIQDVTITEIDSYKGTLPRFSVTASSVRFSLEDILRQLATASGSSWILP